MTDTIIINAPSGVADQPRTCRYGHGPLKHVDKIGGKPLFIAMAYGFYDSPMVNPKYVGPLRWYLCPVCGYMELVDLTPDATLSLLESEHG